MIDEMTEIFQEKKRLYAKLPRDASLTRKYRRDFRIAKGERFGCIDEPNVVVHHIVASTEVFCLGKGNMFNLEIINIYQGRRNEYILVFRK